MLVTRCLKEVYAQRFTSTCGQVNLETFTSVWHKESHQHNLQARFGLRTKPHFRKLIFCGFGERCSFEGCSGVGVFVDLMGDLETKPCMCFGKYYRAQSHSKCCAGNGCSELVNWNEEKKRGKKYIQTSTTRVEK